METLCQFISANFCGISAMSSPVHHTLCATVTVSSSLTFRLVDSASFFVFSSSYFSMTPVFSVRGNAEKTFHKNDS